MLTELDRIVVAARYNAPVRDAFCTVLGAEVVGRDRVSVWSAERTTLRLGVGEVEVLEPDGVGAVADFLGRRGPGLFAVGFAHGPSDAFRIHLEDRGVSFEKQDLQLFLTAGRGVDLPFSIVISPARERERVGLLERIHAAVSLHRDAGVAGRLARVLGAKSSRVSSEECVVSSPPGTLLRVGEDGAGQLAVLEPWGVTTPIGRFFLRYGPRLYMAAAQSKAIATIRERLSLSGHSGGAPLLVPSELLGGVRLGVFPASNPMEFA